MTQVVSFMQISVCRKAVTLLMAADLRDGEKFWMHTFEIIYLPQSAVRENAMSLNHLCFR
jgi:hypothetical protein